MTALEIPANLERMRAEATTWVSDLPALVEDLTDCWSLTVGRPFQPGGTTS